MSKTIQPAPSQRVEADFYPSLKNPAVALCTEAWEKILRATAQTTGNLYTAERCAAKAYRLCLPPLSSSQEIRDFIACVGYGVLLGAIKAENGTKLIYAAQVALSAVPCDSKPSKPLKTKPKTQPKTAARRKIHPATPRTIAATPSNQ